MDHSFMLSVPRTAASAAWIQEFRPTTQRGEQIQAAFSRPVVKMIGLGSVEGSSVNPGGDDFHFACLDLEQALAEFPEVGRRLGFPPGTRLIYFGREWMTSHTAIRTVATW